MKTISRHLVTVLFALFLMKYLPAQNVAINTDGSDPDVSAMQGPVSHPHGENWRWVEI